LLFSEKISRLVEKAADSISPEDSLVREVGFEPTNPYGTGASGLRVQDPHLNTGLFDLAWQNRPPQRRTPANTRPAPAERQRKDKALIGFPHHPSPENSGKCLFQPRPNPALKSSLSGLERESQTWPPDAEKHDDSAQAAAMAGDDPANTATAACRVDMVMLGGNATAGAA
jgi:hypothetical protein